MSTTKFNIVFVSSSSTIIRFNSIFFRSGVKNKMILMIITGCVFVKLNLIFKFLFSFTLATVLIYANSHTHTQLSIISFRSLLLLVVRPSVIHIVVLIFIIIIFFLTRFTYKAHVFEKTHTHTLNMKKQFTFFLAEY